MTERQGIEIDYCPDCRGVWLDRGELDKMLAQARDESRPTADAAQSAHGVYPAQVEQWPAGGSDATGQPAAPQAPAPGADGWRGDGGAYRGDRGWRDDRAGDERYRDDRGWRDSGYRDHRDSRSGDYRDDRSRDPRYRRRKKSPFEFLGDIFD